jgi:hypothetical protein
MRGGIGDLLQLGAGGHHTADLSSIERQRLAIVFDRGTRSPLRCFAIARLA